MNIGKDGMLLELTLGALKVNFSAQQILLFLVGKYFFDNEKENTEYLQIFVLHLDHQKCI